MGRQSVRVSELSTHENAELRRGGSMMKDKEPFEDSKRPCRDVIWAILFYVLAGFLCWWCASGIIAATGAADKGQAAKVSAKLHAYENSLFAVGYALAAAGMVAIVFSLVFLELAKRFSELVIWCALLLGPTVMIVVGVGMMVPVEGKWPMPGIFGAISFSIGCCLFACVLCCWKDLVAFSAALMRTIIKVVEIHTSMIFISIWGSFLSFLWSLLCCMSLVAFAIHDEEAMDKLTKGRASSSPAKAGFLFLFFFVQYWGLMVAMDAAYTACCGVFGRWYFLKDRRPGDTPVMSAIKDAYTTSFGSICLGAFIVALIRALEALVRTLRREAQEDGNIVLCLLLCLVECVIDCIGDIMEWVCSWAYVQCALRGLSFFQACSATFALSVHAGVDSIISRSVLGLVPILGALPAGLFAGGAGYFVFGATSEDGAQTSHQWGVALICMWLGLCTAWAALMPLKSGASTIIMCFAEEPDNLRNLDPSLHHMFCDHDDARSSIASSSSRSSRASIDPRQLRATPMLEMQGVRQLQVTVPQGVSAGQMVQVQTPEGQMLQVQVPAGYGPGQQFVASY
ncbi:PNS1 [Symbiodinium sp. KB8]|nr:PNS1 [Symbiodinium sp. KB8]